MSINIAAVLMMVSRGAFFRDVTWEVTSQGRFADKDESHKTLSVLKSKAKEF